MKTYKHDGIVESDIDYDDYDITENQIDAVGFDHAADLCTIYAGPHKIVFTKSEARLVFAALGEYLS